MKFVLPGTNAQNQSIDVALSVDLTNESIVFEVGQLRVTVPLTEARNVLAFLTR